MVSNGNLYNAFGAGDGVADRVPRVRCATLGFVVAGLRPARRTDPGSTPEQKPVIKRNVVVFS